jgi:predicted PurR-regulated permease PerM
MQVERQIIYWSLALALLVALLYSLSAVLMPFAAGLCVAYLLDPVADRLEHMGLNRLAASVLILAVFSLVFILTLIVLLPILTHQLIGFIERLPDYVMQLRALAADQGGELFDRAQRILADSLGLDLGDIAGVKGSDVQSSVGDIVKQGSQWIGSFFKSLWSGGQALVSLFSLIVITPVVAFYLLVDWQQMMQHLQALGPFRHRPVVHAIALDINRAIAGFLRGQSLVCLFLGTWYGVGLTLVGLNFGLLIGISAGVLSFIPYVGSLTALVLACGVAIVQGWPSWHLLILSLVVVGTGQFLEGNVLTPRLVGASVGLHPVWLIFALLAAGNLFGMTGLILAVPIAAALGVLLRFAFATYMASPYYQGSTQDETATGMRGGQ